MKHHNRKQQKHSNNISPIINSKSQLFKVPQNISVYRLSQDKSISSIRNIARQIKFLQSSCTTNKCPQTTRTKQSNKTHTLAQSSFSQLNQQTLYDKYKQQNKPKFQMTINNLHQIINREKKQQLPSKKCKNNKYKNIPSKHSKQQQLNKTLNYHKKLPHHIQQYFQYKPAPPKTKQQIKQLTLNGLLKHIKQMQLKKKKYIQNINSQKIKNQQLLYSYKPKIISKKNPNIQSTNFQQRKQLADTHKIIKCNSLIKQCFKSFTFYPRTNCYKQSNSKILKLWKKQSNFNNNYHNTNTEKGLVTQPISSRYLNTPFTGSEINLNHVNQLSFIFQ